MAANFNFTAWCFTRLGARNVRTLRRIGCDECSHPICWWNRRVWRDSEHCVHLRCFQSELYMKALLAEEVGNSQLFGNNPSRCRRAGPQHTDNGSTDDMRPFDPSTTSPRESVKWPQAERPHAKKPNTHAEDNNSTFD